MQEPHARPANVDVRLQRAALRRKQRSSLGETSTSANGVGLAIVAGAGGFAAGLMVASATIVGLLR